MRDDGIRNALVFATSATSSYSSCRQYRDDLARAQQAVGADAPRLTKLRHFFDHPGFITATASGLRDALGTLPDALRDDARLVFTAHSIPVSMNDASGPERNGAVRGRAARDRAADGRGGPRARGGVRHGVAVPLRAAQVPWLEPDVNDHLERWPPPAGTR